MDVLLLSSSRSVLTKVVHVQTFRVLSLVLYGCGRGWECTPTGSSVTSRGLRAGWEVWFEVDRTGLWCVLRFRALLRFTDRNLPPHRLVRQKLPCHFRRVRPEQGEWRSTLSDWWSVTPSPTPTHSPLCSVSALHVAWDDPRCRRGSSPLLRLCLPVSLSFCVTRRPSSAGTSQSWGSVHR